MTLRGWLGVKHQVSICTCTGRKGAAFSLNYGHSVSSCSHNFWLCAKKTLRVILCLNVFSPIWCIPLVDIRLCVCVCVPACMHACVHECVCVCVRDCTELKDVIHFLILCLYMYTPCTLHYIYACESCMLVGVFGREMSYFWWKARPMLILVVFS